MGLLLARYLASQIENLSLKYKEVVERYPKEKNDIDDILHEDGMDELIDK